MQVKYFDPWTPNTFLTYTVTKFHESFETDFQTIDVFEAKDWGTVLCLGGVTNVTDRDESPYHEMLAHVPLFAHPNPRRVLVIGGGDGGTLREVLRHPGVEEAVNVDIDAEVVRCAREYFPRLAAAFDHPKANLIIGDGLAYVDEAAKRGEAFDVILVDSTDPVDAAVELFTPAFYRSCASLLGDTGILVPQSDSPSFNMHNVKRIWDSLGAIFSTTSLYLAQTIAYPAGLWAFVAATNGTAVGDVTVPRERIDAMLPQLRYFNADMMRGAFALPTYIRRGLDSEAWSGDVPQISDVPPYE